jgi:tetratricopeptide (TPR) repeat protein
MLLGIVLDGENRPREAEQEFKTALRLQPGSAAIHIDLGKHYAQQGNLVAATREFESATHLAPGNPVPYESLGLVLMAQKQHALAVRDFEKAADLAPRDPPVLLNLFKAQLAARQVPQARVTLGKIEALAPRSVNVDAGLGAIQAEGGDFAGAIETLDKARVREPGSTEILYNLGLAYDRSGNAKQAVKTLELAQQLKDAGDVENLLGQAYEDNHQYLDAAKALQKATELEPSNESYRFDFTLELLKHRSFDAAIVAAQHDVADFPDSMRPRLILGVAYFGRGMHSQSVATFLAAAKRLPDSELPLFCLAQAASVTGESGDEMQSLVGRYSQLHPAQAWPYYYLGQRAAQEGEASSNRNDVQKAEALLKKSIALDPRYAESYYELGNVYTKLGQWPQAARAYRTAVALKSDLAQAHYRLAAVYRRLGDPSAAQEELQIHQDLMRQQSDQTVRDQNLQTFLYKLTR